MQAAILLLGIDPNFLEDYASGIISILQRFGVNHEMTTFVCLQGVIGQVFDNEARPAGEIAMIGIPAFSELLENGQLPNLLKEINRQTGIATTCVAAPVYANFGGETV